MTRYPLFALAALLAAPAAAAAQADAPAPADDAAVIEKATLAAPPRVRAEAGVVRWDANHNRIVVRESGNGLVCWDRSDVPGTPDFAVQCSAVGNLPRFEQNRRFALAAADADERRALMDAAEAGGTRVAAKFGSVWYSLSGRDRENANPHTTIAVPYAIAPLLGVPDERRTDGIWLMQAGTSSAHLMVPGR